MNIKGLITDIKHTFFSRLEINTEWKTEEVKKEFENSLFDVLITRLDHVYEPRVIKCTDILRRKR